jgi:predicted nuclease of predicted toxin-antitoxin system
MPVTPGAAPHLHAAGHDAIHASDVGLSNVADATILAAARRDDRIVVTADLDYPRLLALEHADGPGLILFRGGSYSDAEMLGLLDRILALEPASDLERCITVVDRTRIRKHRLPVR